MATGLLLYILCGGVNWRVATQAAQRKAKDEAAPAWQSQAGGDASVSSRTAAETELPAAKP